MPLRVPADLLEELGAFTGYFWSDFRLEPIICDAIRAYMKPAPAAPAQPAAPAEERCVAACRGLPVGAESCDSAFARR
jgi:hypothetical protein